MHGVSSDAARAVAAGQRRALADGRARAGRYRIRLVPLDSTRPGDRPWDPGQLSMNADRAAHDRKAVAYLGELEYGASAVSVPITKPAGLLQGSPGVGLARATRPPPAAAPRVRAGGRTRQPDAHAPRRASARWPDPLLPARPAELPAAGAGRRSGRASV